MCTHRHEIYEGLNDRIFHEHKNVPLTYWKIFLPTLVTFRIDETSAVISKNLKKEMTSSTETTHDRQNTEETMFHHETTYITAMPEE